MPPSALANARYALRPPDNRAAAAASRGYVAAWLHALFLVVISFSGAIGATMAAQSLNSRLSLSGFWAFVTLASGFFCGFNVPMLLFLKFVPARCRKCGGRCWGSFDAGTLIYTCAACGFVRRTRVAAD